MLECLRMIARDLGWSDTEPKPRTSEQMIKELHTSLLKSSRNGCYAIVGINALLYASKYPDEVAGLVLVDSLHKERLECFELYSKSVEIENR